LDVNAEVRVWVYADAHPASPTCIDLLPDMVPLSMAAGTPAKAVGCTMDITALSRLRFVPDNQDVLHLRSIEALLLAAGTLPQPYRYSRCLDILPHLLPASADPATAAYWLVCDYEMPARDHRHDEPIRIWSALPVAAPIRDFPPDVRCWELTRYLGAPMGIETFNLPCILN
jgi:hypothetical protein